MIVAGGLNFGGPAVYPQGRNDTLYVFNDTVTYVAGRHSLRAGGEYRRFLNDNFAEGTGLFNFPSVPAFLAGTANAFSITLGERRSHITQDAVAFFVQDQFRISSNLTLDLGLRYEWHVTPTERDDQFVVFDAARASLVRVGVDVDEIYQQNNANVEPRLGVAWTPSADGRTVVRAALRVGRRPAEHDGGAGHGRQSAVRDSADGDRLDCAGDRGDHDAAGRPRTGHGRSAVPERVAAIVERQRAATTRQGFGRDGGLFRLERQAPAHLAQHQSARGRRPRRSRRSRPRARSAPARRSATSRRWRAPASPATTRSGCRPRSGCPAACCSTRPTPGRSRSIPIRSIRPASPSRTATTFPTSTACRISTRGIDSCSAPPTSSRSPDTR